MLRGGIHQMTCALRHHGEFGVAGPTVPPITAPCDRGNIVLHQFVSPPMRIGSPANADTRIREYSPVNNRAYEWERQLLA
jgi:hypothetical protein